MAGFGQPAFCFSYGLSSHLWKELYHTCFYNSSGEVGHFHFNLNSVLISKNKWHFKLKKQGPVYMAHITHYSLLQPWDGLDARILSGVVKTFIN